MSLRECVAMILAGGRGERLGSLTQYYSKPAIYFGGKYRIIDFTLSNCRNSGIDTVGILSQCFTTDLNEYVGSVHGNRPGRGGVHVLSSRNNENLYKGTADSVYKNLAFIEQFTPEHVLILASDHIYRMNYKKLIAFHKEKGADVTVASMVVPTEETTRFGILNSDKNGRVLGFEEKPRRPKSNLASMGIYVFKWSYLKKYLLEDSNRKQSKHDFSIDILPEMLSDKQFYTYQFNGYWRDVGTVNKLWEANMDQLDNPSMLRLMDSERNACSPRMKKSTGFISDKAVISQSIVSGACSIFGDVGHSVLSNSVTVGKGSKVINSVIMPKVYIGDNVKIYNAIVGTYAAILDNSVIGSDYGSEFFVDSQMCAGGVSLVSPWAHIIEGVKIQKSSHISNEKLVDYQISAAGRLKFTHKTVEYAAAYR